MSIDIEAINLTSLEFWKRSDRMEALAALRERNPISWHEFVESPEKDMEGFWALTRYDDVVRVSNDSKTFASAPSTIMGDQSRDEARNEGWFLNMDGGEHFALRKIVSKAFSPQNVQRLSLIARHYAEKLVLAAKERGSCDFAQDVAQPFPVEVVCDFLGAPKENRKWLHETTLVALAGDAQGADNLAAIPAAFDALNAYGEDIARERRKRPAGDDILSVVIEADIDGKKLSDRDVGHFFQLLVTAGMETTGTAGGQLFRVFLENPEQMAIWAANPETVGVTGIEEIVRYISPIMHMRRTATVDTEISGHPIAAGDKIVMWYIAANRDPSQFEYPDTFDVLRNPNRHVGFGGGGRHTCLGAHLARMELPILVETIFKHMRDFEPDGQPVFAQSRFVNGLSSLPVRYKAI